METKNNSIEKEKDKASTANSKEEWFEVVSQFLVELRKEADHEE